MSPMPLKIGIIAFCFLPYTKKPKPTDPNIIPQIKVDALFIYSLSYPIFRGFSGSQNNPLSGLKAYGQEAGPGFFTKFVFH
jgi:hypothetical protein